MKVRGIICGVKAINTNTCNMISGSSQAIVTTLTTPTLANVQRLTIKIPEAASLLGVSIPTIRRAIERGDIRVNRKLRHVLIPLAEIERFASA
jgi:excisionase family DNA binding protein